ncbi:MFS transporter [Buchnera aphidicola]|uniref:MFS transporter n=1 Tax=Buchnera aphidicola subsp. Melaphis rhois TaxID=118103 RepID=A0A4D6Y2R5_BUCMH|nr:MFS transporter [Buchnera aphidicola]QCI23427.1 MFS transporter [Buchnera aphidicola (Melaphis rhois)]
MNKFNISLIELRIIIALCIVFALRVLGMFIVLPVFSVYGIFLKDSTSFLIGVAIGVYGLFQAIFQIPYGWLSDKIGRKFVIILGLLFFFVGSFICFRSNSIWGMMLGRSLQGSGAISSVCMALLSDIISERNKTKAMGLLGISFGISFMFSIVFSPIIVRMFGFHFLFLVSMLLSIICIIVVWYVIPLPLFSYNIFFVKHEFKKVLNVFKNYTLFQFNLSIFFLHVLLTLHFIIIPVQSNVSKIFVNFSWIIYLTTIMFSFFIVFSISKYLKNKYIKLEISLSIFFLVVSNIIFLFFKNNYFFLIIGLQIFFMVFSFLEMVLPISVSRHAPLKYKGTAMAIYSISQFFGSSIGGILGGIILNHYNSDGLFLFELVVSFLWLLINIRYF